MSTNSRQKIAVAASVVISAGIGICTNVFTEKTTWAWGSGLVAMVVLSILLQLRPVMPTESPEGPTRSDVTGQAAVADRSSSVTQVGGNAIFGATNRTLLIIVIASFCTVVILVAIVLRSDASDQRTGFRPPQSLPDSAAAAALASPAASPEPPPAECGRHNSLYQFSVVVPRYNGDTAGECIGYSNSEGLKFGSGKNLPEAQSRIFRYNREVERMVDAGWRNPRSRLVLMTAMTSKLTLPADERYPAEREAMEGIAIAQFLALKDAKQTPSRPFLEVLVANAGQGGGQVGRLLPEIERLVQSDATVAAVLVAMDSRTSTRTAMQKLQSHGLLVLTATGAADRLSEGMTRFLQLQTTTREQSRLVRAYAKRLGQSRIVDIYTRGDPAPTPQNADLYVDDLREGLHTMFGGDYEEGQWGDSKFDLRARCHDRYNGIVFYGGRYTEFHGFLKELYTTCGRENLPILVAAGNTARYVVGEPRTTGREWAPSDYPLVFSSNGVASATCNPANPNARQALFLEAVKMVLKQCQELKYFKPLGVRMGPAFDIITIMLDAVTRLAAGGVKEFTGAEIYAKIMERNQRETFYGVSGPVHFDGRGVIDSGGESLMCVRNIKEAYTRSGRETIPYEIASTGTHGTPTIGKDWCPLPRH